MGRKELHPAVAQFKEFVKEHPGLIRSVRNGDHGWQELFEEWYLLGSEDPRWDPFKPHTGKGEHAQASAEQKDGSSGWIQHVASLVKNMDVNQMQYYARQLSEAIAMIQGFLSQYQGSQPQETNAEKGRMDPFAFRKD
ncbi:MAG TPA: YlbD family protein [Bacillaceae bacterium]